jgi:2-methylcitrate dehydratase PrpD
VLAGRQRLNALGAAFANGVAAHALDFDDNSYAGFVHASAVIVPAALAVSQEQDLGGSDYLLSYIAGAECEFALAASLGTAPYTRGWWTTSLFGATGACAAACHALRLDVDATASALGLAVVASAGTKAGFGSDAKPILVGCTAEMGVKYALLARDGVQGPGYAIEASNGLAALVGGDMFDSEPFAALGTTWQLRHPGIDTKRIPVCLSSHAAVDSLRDIIAAAPPSNAITRIVCDVPPIVVKNLMYLLPLNAQQAQFSMAFALAAVVVHGDLNLGLLTAATLADAAMQAAMRRVEMISSHRWDDPALSQSAPEGAWVLVCFADGTSVERFRAMPKGAAADPMSSAEIEAKFLACSRPVLGANASSTLLAALNDLDRLPCIRELAFGETPLADLAHGGKEQAP